MRKLIAAAFTVLALGLAACSPTANAQTGSAASGIAPGAMAPAISGTTQAGNQVTFNDLKGERGLVIVFFRSADWCPFCKQQLKDLNSIPDDLEARGFKLAALSYDSVETLAKFAKANKTAYTLVSDPKSVVIDAFGIRNLEMAGSARMDGIPYPAIYIVGADGKILDRLFEESYRKRPPTDVVLKAVDSAMQKMH
jgi:peroxiredoxin